MNLLQDDMVAALLKEILMVPSTELQMNRFTNEDKAAACNGKCRTGQCRTITE